MAADQQYLTQPEAAALCGCDYSTIKRHRERGHFPGVRRRQDANGTYEVPIADLITAGLWNPTDDDELAVSAAIGRTRTERKVEELRLELERAKAEIAGLTAVLVDRRDEVVYLRRALDAALEHASAA